MSTATAHETPTPDDARLRLTLPGRLLVLARARGRDVALREKHLGIWQEFSWNDYLRHTERVGHALWHMGVRPGDHIAVLSNNRTEWLFADLGAEGIGARTVGIYETSPASDVAYIVGHSRSKVLFCEDQEQVDKALEIAGELPALQRIVVFDPRGTRGYDDERLQTWKDFIARGESLRAQEPGWFAQRVAEMDPDAPCMVVYTSGTTGTPKGALLSSRNVTSGGDANASRLGTDASDTLLSYLPLCHVAEKIFTFFQPLTLGNVVHFGESIDTVQTDLREVSPTVFLGVPRIWEKIHAGVAIKMHDASWLKRTLFDFCVRQGYRISRARLAGTARALDTLVWWVCDLLVFRALQERLGMRNCRLPISGAAPISPELLEWFHAVGIPILEGYGMTEAAGGTHINPPGAPRLGTVGPPLDHVEQKIDDNGEILLHGACVFLGYLHDDESTAAAIDADGWLHTGDIGEIGADGYLTITGRKKEILITSGGKNISPERVENALKMSPFIKEAVAIGDGRKFIAALVQIETDTVGDWATREHIPYTSFEDLSSRPQVVELIGTEIRRCNTGLNQAEQVKAFRLFPKELHQDDGELTATQKVRRKAVHRAYAELIEGMYQRKGPA